VDLARTTLLSAAIATRRDFSTTRLNVQTYYMATEFVKRGMGCSITDIFSARHNLAPAMIHPIAPPMMITLCLLRRADVSLSPISQKFVDFLCTRLRQQLQEINLGYTLKIKSQLRRRGKCFDIKPMHLSAVGLSGYEKAHCHYRRRCYRAGNSL
jgi:hypothetical protein